MDKPCNTCRHLVYVVDVDGNFRSRRPACQFMWQCDKQSMWEEKKK